MNGELGTVRGLALGRIDETARLTRHRAVTLDLAEAIAVHEARGSAFDRVVNGPPSPSRRRSALAWHMEHRLRTRESGRRGTTVTET